MSSKKGWIKLYRDITEHWVYQDPLLLKVWITVLCLANHDDHRILINNNMTTIHRGQFWTSIRKLSSYMNMDKDTVKKKLDLLQSDGMIYLDSQKGRGTLLTVLNYSVYQNFSGTPADNFSDTGWDTSRDTDWDKVQTQSGTQSRHKQEYKNDKALLKNGKNNGLPPDHPDYFEEV